VSKAVCDLTDTLRGGKPSKASDELATAVKNLSDTVHTVVKDVGNAAKNAHDAARMDPATTSKH
jgi:outer membrane murein-binding lipoprotein Lpp